MFNLQTRQLESNFFAVHKNIEHASIQNLKGGAVNAEINEGCILLTSLIDFIA